MIRISMPVNYGFFANATSLNTQAQKIFRELANLMNKTKSFTITASTLGDSFFGNVNLHYECVHVPNMGGYKFPPDSVLNSKNLIIGLVGIDEIILGRESFRTEDSWKRDVPIMKKELQKWEKNIDKIKLIHVNTKSEKQQMNEYLKIPNEKMHIIPLGVDHNFFRPVENKENTRKKILSKFFMKDTPFILHISEMNWARKNIIRMLKAFHNAKKTGIPHKLIIIGKNDPIIYKKASTIPDVHVLGFIDQNDLLSFIQSSDVFLMPSLHEGWGLPMVESMSCGIPIITSNSFSAPEILKDGGLFVDPYDVLDITRKILEVIKDNKMRETLGKNALKRSLEFSWEKTAAQIYELYKKLDLPQDSSYDFEYNYEVSVRRTLVTIMKLRELVNLSQQDLLEFDFSRISNWALYVGINDAKIRDYILPFKNWLEEQYVRN